MLSYMQTNKYEFKEEYDTSINIIGSIKELDTIVSLLKAELYPDLYNRDRVKLNLEIRSEKSVSRIEHGVRKAFLSFKNEEHEKFIYKLFSKQLNKFDMSFLLYWQFLATNLLFREITERVFVKYYFDGRAYIDSDDILGFLVELKKGSLEIVWSELTLKVLASKYLNLMSKFGFIKKEGRRLEYSYITLSSKMQVLLLYFSRFYPWESNSKLSNELAKLSFIPQEDLVQRYKVLSKEGLFDMSYNGEFINIEFNNDIESVIDVLFE